MLQSWGCHLVSLSASPDGKERWYLRRMTTERQWEGLKWGEALWGISVALSHWLFTKILHINDFFCCCSGDEDCCPLKICLVSYEITVPYTCDSNTNKGLMAFITSSTEGILMGIHESQTNCTCESKLYWNTLHFHPEAVLGS